jgi:glycerate kinase
MPTRNGRVVAIAPVSPRRTGGVERVRPYRSVRVVLTSDSYAAADPAAATAQLVDGWRSSAPHDELVALPSSAGGPGMLAAVRAALGGEPLPGPGAGLLTGTDDARTAWIEAADCPGPGSTGVGRSLAAAVSAGARRVVVGLGGTGVPDAGAGLFAGLGLPVPTELGAMAGLTASDLGALVGLRRRLARVELVGAYDEDRPLLGLAGVGASVVDRGPGGRARAQTLERAFGGWAAAVTAALADELPADLLATGHQTPSQRLTGAPGAGAGGGLGFALAALGGRLLPGAAVLADAVDLDAVLATADLAVVGVPRLDWDSASSGVVGHLAARALELGVPVVVLTDESLVGRRDLSGVGLVGSYVTEPGPDRLHALARRVARTWSPPGAVR